MYPRACFVILLTLGSTGYFLRANESKPAHKEAAPAKKEEPAKKDEHSAKPKEAAHGAPAPAPAANKGEPGAKPAAKEAAHGAPAPAPKKDEHGAKPAGKESALGPVAKKEEPKPEAKPAVRPLVRLPRPPVRRAPKPPAASGAYRVEVHADIYEAPRTAEQALKQLMDGNNRFQAGTATHPRSTVARLREVTRNPNPHTIVLTCADSTIPPELVLDQGIGDMITLRVAGNVSSKDQAASIIYALNQYSPRLLVVLGHTDCPVIRSVASGDRRSSDVDQLMAPLREAAEKTRYYNPDLRGGELLDEVARVNVWSTVLGLLRGNPAVSGYLRTGGLKVVGGVVDSQTGKVGWMGEFPSQLSSLR